MKTLFFLLPAFLTWFAFNPTTAIVIGIIGFAYVMMNAPQKQKRNLILFPASIFVLRKLGNTSVILGNKKNQHHQYSSSSAES